METQYHSSATNPQAGDAGQPLPSYPLTRRRLGSWLRRGERWGEAACWIAATVAAGHSRAAAWRRQAESKGPIDSPPQPG